MKLKHSRSMSSDKKVTDVIDSWRANVLVVAPGDGDLGEELLLGLVVGDVQVGPDKYV